MYIPKFICTTVLLFYCSLRPAHKDYFPTKVAKGAPSHESAPKTF